MKTGLMADVEGEVKQLMKKYLVKMVAFARGTARAELFDADRNSCHSLKVIIICAVKGVLL